MIAHGLLQALVPLFFVLALGYLAGRRHAFDQDQAAGFNTLLVEFALPAMLFTGVIGIDHAALASDARLLAAFAIVFGAGFAIVAALVRVIAKRPVAEAAIIALVCTSPAAPFFGPSVLGPLYPQGNAGTIALAALAINALQVPLALTVISVAQGKEQAAKREPQPSLASVAGKALATPMVLAPLAGLSFVLLGVTLPGWAVSSTHLIGSATSGVAVFSAGLTLAAHRLEWNRTVLASTGTKLLLVPAATLLAGRTLGVEGAPLEEAVVLGALSSGLIGLILASRFRVGVAAAGSTVILSAVGMAITLPLWILSLTG